MSEPRVLVEVSDGGSHRQIGARRRVTELLSSRRDEIEAAIRETTQIIVASASAETAKSSWRVSEIEATFGLTLSADAGVVVSRLSTEASFEVKITVARRE